MLRESHGEIEAAEKVELPALISLDDVRGDLHAYTKALDGKNTLREMGDAAMAKDYAYPAITNHSKSQHVAGGLSERQRVAQTEEIARLNKTFDEFRLLSSCDVDILRDGSLDFPYNWLQKLGFTLAFFHYGFNITEEEQTGRIIRVMDNPLVNVIGHPTGRLIGERRPYAVNIGRLVMPAKARVCCLELNADLHRLDLNDLHCSMAKNAA